MKKRPLLRAIILLLVLAIPLAGCGSEQGASHQNDAKESDSGKNTAGKKSVEKKYTPPEKLLSAPEPAESPPLTKEPAGKVVHVGFGPEGLVADAKTGLVAVGLRNPDQLALVDGGSGEVVRKVDLSGSPRHLGLAAPGGPVLVPEESSDTLVQVGLPDGKVLNETPVDDFPHNAAATPGGRIFVVSEAASTASVIENGKVIHEIKTTPNPGGVAITRSGLVGIVDVRGLALEVYEADTLDPLGRIDAGKGPTHVEAGPDNRFYVADTRGDAVLVYEASPELEQVARVPLPGGAPYGIAVDPQRNQLWVTLTAENRLVQFALDGSAPRKIASYPTVRQPNSVDVNPTSGRVFVAGRTGEVLQMIDP